jgi:hypothetical protein
MSIPCWWLNSAPHDTSLPSASLLDGLSGAMCGALLETFLGVMWAENHQNPFDLQILIKIAGSTPDQFCHKPGFWEADQCFQSPLVAGWKSLQIMGILSIFQVNYLEGLGRWYQDSTL